MLTSPQTLSPRFGAGSGNETTDAGQSPSFHVIPTQIHQYQLVVYTCNEEHRIQAKIIMHSLVNGVSTVLN